MIARQQNRGHGITAEADTSTLRNPNAFEADADPGEGERLFPEPDAELIRQLVEAALGDSGIEADAALVDELVEAVEAIASVQAARLIGAWLARLPQTPGGEAVCRLLLSDSESINSAARRIGCDASTLLRAERRLRRFIGDPTFVQWGGDTLRKKYENHDF